MKSEMKSENRANGNIVHVNDNPNSFPDEERV